MTKGDVLIESGVDSAGAGNAKGLLKSFNANSGAAGNAGKKS